MTIDTVKQIKPQRRFTEHFKTGKPLVLPDTHAAIVNAKTLFPSRVFDVKDKLLKPGAYQRKLGSHVVKGRWSGMPIFTLTLEERATCPLACGHWNDCYGNHTPFSKRYKHGSLLEERLDIELTALAKKYLKGFVIRLHILGDFYSVHYAMEWGRWLQRFPNLNVFGYTARWDDDIGLALEDVRNAFPGRWWMRRSGHDADTWLSTGESGIVCPVQTGKADCCGTCALCWTAEKPIKFLVH